MKYFCKLNNISASMRYKLEEKNVLNSEFSDDINFLKLRSYYTESAMFAWDKDGFRSYLMYRGTPPTRIADINAYNIIKLTIIKDILFSVQMVHEFSGFPVSIIDTEIARQGIIPAHHPMMFQKDSLFAAKPYYNAKHLIPVLKQLISADMAKHTHTKYSHSDEVMNRFTKGLTIKHPDGQAGVERSLALYRQQCCEILEPEKVAAPQEPALTYETIDYDKLDLRRIYKKKNFKQFLTLCNCADKDHLIDFLMGDGSDASLAVLAKKVSKLPTMQQLYTGVTIQQLAPTTTQPTKSLTIAEKKQKFKDTAAKYFPPRPQPRDYDGKTLTQMFNMETAAARATYKALTGEDGVDQDYYELLINSCRTSEHATSAQKKIDYVTMQGLIPSDIKEEDYDQFTEDYLNSEVERVLPTIYKRFDLWEYYCKNIDKDTLKDESRRAENVQLFLEACEDIKDGEYVNSYVTVSDMMEMLNVYSTDQIIYQNKQMTIKAFFAAVYKQPEDKVLKWSVSRFENVTTDIKNISNFIISAIASEKSRRAEEKLAAAQGSLDLLTLPFYQGLLDYYKESPDDRPWIDNSGRYTAKTRADYEITRILDEIPEIGDPAEAARLNELSYLLETFKASLTGSEALPDTDEEYIEQLQQHIIAQG